jgi:hypothetical protein
VDGAVGAGVCNALRQASILKSPLYSDFLIVHMLHHLLFRVCGSANSWKSTSSPSRASTDEENQSRLPLKDKNSLLMRPPLLPPRPGGGRLAASRVAVLKGRLGVSSLVTTGNMPLAIPWQMLGGTCCMSR